MRASGGQGSAAAERGAARALRAEAVPVETLAAHPAGWAALQARAIEGNVFLDPGFAVPLFRGGAAARRSEMLAVWDGERLVGLMPVRLPRRRRAGLASGLRDPMVTAGTPLLDRDCAAESFAAMLRWVAGRPSRPAGLLLAGIPAEGPFSRLLAEASHPVATLARFDRAVLRRAGGNVLSLASAKTRKERKRQRRRLAEQGERAYTSARSPEAVARAVERFLLLERKGWKGERGTALLVDERLAAFAREMTAAMAAEGKCRIDALEVDGQAVAMGIVLTSGDRAHFWKTAFDEELAPLSPGVQFATDLADVQLADAAVALTDSCAIPDHPMIDRLWPDRLPIVDVAVGLGPRATPAFVAAVLAERVGRRVRDAAKATLALARRRLRRSRS